MFYITISNGLLSSEHRKRMGTAVWEFMWCIDKVTRVDAGGVGYVLGGKPINLSDLAEKMGVDTETVSRNLARLEENGYIKKTRTPYGIVIKVIKTKKRFGRNVESKGNDKNVESDLKNVESNKTVQLDNSSKDTATDESVASSKSEKEKPMNLKEFVEYCKKSKGRHIHIIGEWAEAEGPNYETWGQWQSYMRRNLRVAARLAPFSMKQIEDAYTKMWKDVKSKKNPDGFITKYSLETLEKYI